MGDIRVALRSLARMLGAVTLAAGLLCGQARVVEACSRIGPGIFGRSIWPSPDQHPPTNVQLVVFYQLGVPLAGFEVPTLGPDLILLDGDGTAVDAFVRPEWGSEWTIIPAAPLLPNHAYQVADRRTVPCDQTKGQCNLTDQPQVFASFTTADGPDTTPPVFEGLDSLAPEPRTICGDSACCGPYDGSFVDLTWRRGSDAVAGAALRYNVYYSPPGGVVAIVRIAGPLDAVTWRGFQTCHGSSPFSDEARPGPYLVRAVDWAGNEDGNAQSHRLDASCSDPADAGTADAPHPKVSSGPFGCTVAGPARPGTADGWAMLALGVAGAFALARGRRLSRRDQRR